MKLCEVCKSAPATVPDRTRLPGRMVNRLCARCHAARLSGDLMEIVRRRADRAAPADTKEPKPLPESGI